MIRAFRLILFILLGSYYCQSFAQVHTEKDGLADLIRIKDVIGRDRKIMEYIKYGLGATQAEIEKKRNIVIDSLSKYDFENKKAFLLFTDAIFNARVSRYDIAKKYLIEAVEEVQQAPDHFLLSAFYTNLAFIQTDQGNPIEASYYYELVKEEVQKLNDPSLEVSLYINISDLYCANELYLQSISSLDKAQRIIGENKLNYPIFFTVINYNKAENYFRLENYDSLKVYHDRLYSSENQHGKLYSFQKRTGYYMLLLKHRYTAAISVINVLLKDTKYVKTDFDLTQLATAYIKIGQADLAKNIIDQLVKEQGKQNHPGVKYRLYEMLGEIAQIKNDPGLSAHYFALALEQSKQNLDEVTQVGNVSAQVRVKDVQGLYYKNLLTFKREQLWLRFIIALSVLAVIVIGIFYRASRQKRHYEKLLYSAQKEELAFINSHEVRKHVANIQGLLELMKDEADEEFFKLKNYLLYSVGQLDNSIKNVSRKLSS
jgi:tetratricopeptide (TPR) repeat protein